jgi:hypothetical protein
MMWNCRMPVSPVDLNQLLRMLRQKKVPFVLTGAHALGGWTGRPRATHDIDILVSAGRTHTRAVKSIQTLYPELEPHSFPGGIAFFISGEKDPVIDVAYPFRGDLEETLIHSVWVEEKAQGVRYRIPALENTLANKYGAMKTLARELGTRQLDGVDFGWMEVHSLDEGRQPIDPEKLAALGEKVWSGGGGKEILRLVEEVKAGRAIQLDSLGKLAGPKSGG